MMCILPVQTTEIVEAFRVKKGKVFSLSGLIRFKHWINADVVISRFDLSCKLSIHTLPYFL